MKWVYLFFSLFCFILMLAELFSYGEKSFEYMIYCVIAFGIYVILDEIGNIKKKLK